MNNCNEIKIEGGVCNIKAKALSAEEAEALISACLNHIVKLKKDVEDLTKENNRLLRETAEDLIRESGRVLRGEIKEEPKCHKCNTRTEVNWCLNCAGNTSIASFDHERRTGKILCNICGDPNCSEPNQKH